MTKLTSFYDDALIAMDNIADLATNISSPTIRLGVTGLSRAGKTVFITSMIHNLVHGGKLPLFEPLASGRIAGIKLEPQPSMALPRFQYEEYLDNLSNDRIWPQSTSAISELRIKIAYESASTWNQTFGSGTLNVDIVDYPGEWLLDLPLLTMSFEAWSAQALQLAGLKNRAKMSKEWLRRLEKIKPATEFDETIARELSDIFTLYLRQCRSDENALSTLPPGRFLMPGDLEGSPVLTFCPLPEKLSETAPALYEQMQKRFEAYKSIVIKPFFREHFARLDRQIILVDALQAINVGPDALRDLEAALSQILECFNPGNKSVLTNILSRRIDRLLFVATKADHLHRDNHLRLENLLRRLVDNAVRGAKFSGASVDVMAIASLRATQEALTKHDNEELPVIVGTPIKGENIDGEQFDGETPMAIFPGDLPENPVDLFAKSDNSNELSFVRFRPPELKPDKTNIALDLPHIRLDKALQFLLGDQLI